MNTQRYCKKCLLREMPEREYFKNLYQYIANLAADDRVPDDVYEQRLDQCRCCGNLLSGMCRLCGCYVELRAAVKVRSCPDIPSKWKSCPEIEDEY